MGCCRGKSGPESLELAGGIEVSPVSSIGPDKQAQTLLNAPGCRKKEGVPVPQILAILVGALG